MIGAEPFVNGVAMLLGKIAAAGAGNISVHPGDARDLIEVLPDGSVSRAFLLYPDPWPKRRHHRRRFVTAEHLAPLARVLAPGRRVPDRDRHPRLRAPGARRGAASRLSRGDGDQRTPWPDWIRTRYEAKALREGRVPHYLTFRRL